MVEYVSGNSSLKKGRSAHIIDPNPDRRKHVTELFYAFMEDKISLAELQGVSREQLFQLAETGHTKFKHGRLEEAEKIFQGLIVLDHRNSYFHGMMGAIHQKKGRPIEAILEYGYALKINNRDIATHVNRGELYLRHKNYKKAAQDFRNAIMLDPTGMNLWSNRARSLVIALKRSMQLDARRPSNVKRSR